MKITLTKKELLPILSRHFGVVIHDASLEDGLDPFVLTALRKSVGQYRFDGDQKIAAIRSLRDFARDNQSLFTYNYEHDPDAPRRPLGLADAKWAVENWSSFLEFVVDNGRVPAPGYSNGLR